MSYHSTRDFSEEFRGEKDKQHFVEVWFRVIERKLIENSLGLFFFVLYKGLPILDWGEAEGVQ